MEKLKIIIKNLKTTTGLINKELINKVDLNKNYQSALQLVELISM